MKLLVSDIVGFIFRRFDVVGAGVCLKRYIDLFFFKVEVILFCGRKLEG